MWPFHRRGYPAPHVARVDLPRIRPGRYGQQLVSTAMVPPPADAPPPPPPPSGRTAGTCDRPPAGWTCPRGYGHDGPCAASPVAGPPRMPHCDAAVLHGPGECEFCDAHPEWQELRRMWGIAFTGHPPRVDVERPWLSEVPCPSDARRPGGANQLWPGNRPEGYEHGR